MNSLNTSVSLEKVIQMVNTRTHLVNLQNLNFKKKIPWGSRKKKKIPYGVNREDGGGGTRLQRLFLEHQCQSEMCNACVILKERERDISVV